MDVGSARLLRLVLVLVATCAASVVVASPARAAGPADLAVWRPSNGTWYLRGGSTVQWGRRGDQPVPADYDGDGRADLAVWRPSTGTWYVRGARPVQWGRRRGDQPVPADYDGDGRADLAVWRPSTGTWYVRGIMTRQLGRNGDRPVPADYTGDHRADPAVWRPSDGTWHIADAAPFAFGVKGDLPVPADYLSYDHAEPAVWRPSTGKWYVRGGPTIRFGTSGDVPLPGDYDASGTAEPAVWRPWNRAWYSSGSPTVHFGGAGDVPVPGDFADRQPANGLDVRTLTFDGADSSSIIRSADTVTMAAPASNNSLSNLRKVFWPVGQPAASDRAVCATWADQSDGVVQEGVALRVTTAPGVTRALTVTKNVIFGVQWEFNVHEWDSASSTPFTALAQYDMSAVVTADGQYQPLPWRICARTTGGALTFKVWLPGREPEPGWSDAVHARTTTVPDDYLGPGNFGWYIGHIPAGGSAHFTGLTVSP